MTTSISEYRARLEQRGEDEYRARTLTTIAAGWDHQIFQGDDLGYDALRQLVPTAMEFAHPLLSRDTIQELMEALRDAMNAKRDWEEYGVSPIDDEDLAGYSPAMITSLLERDIDDATWPLLSGLSTAYLCAECRRVSASVASWMPRLAGSSRCGRHS